MSTTCKDWHEPEDGRLASVTCMAGVEGRNLVWLSNMFTLCIIESTYNLSIGRFVPVSMTVPLQLVVWSLSVLLWLQTRLKLVINNISLHIIVFSWNNKLGLKFPTVWLHTKIMFLGFTWRSQVPRQFPHYHAILTFLHTWDFQQEIELPVHFPAQIIIISTTTFPFRSTLGTNQKQH